MWGAGKLGTEKEPKSKSVTVEVVLEGNMTLITCVQNGMKSKGTDWGEINNCNLKNNKPKKYGLLYTALKMKIKGQIRKFMFAELLQITKGLATTYN